MATSLERASAAFLGVAARIVDGQWRLDTPCDGWAVRDLVGHVASGSRMAAALASGASRNEAIKLLAADVLGDDPLAGLTDSLDAQLAAFSDPDVLQRTCRHPAGDMPGAQLLGFRVADLVVHRWDLARAIGADESLDDDLVAEIWAGIEPMAPIIGATGVFGTGPSGALTDDAPLQQRLLDLMGRRP